jgi:two-component system, response regulator
VAPDDGSVDILMVEDNPDDERLTLRAFAKNKLTNRIHVVRDGQEALDYVFCTGKYADRKITDRPHVILLDIKLPLIDGIEVLRRIKSDERTRTIPVVMLTSSREERDLVETYRLGVNSYIVKPVDFEQFTESARNLGMYWLLMNRPAKAA